ncbi:hypothetical protein [Halorubellus litoreus]|uniref:Uncharacterized protein n=1 Tax=Halorubellus litoreus TaxID=755308 RepID=A0ABD5VE66_9EURY
MDYNNFGSSSTTSNQNDSDENNEFTLKVTPYAAIDGDLDSAFSVEGKYGQSLAIKMNDVTLVDGALYKRKGDDTHKVFSWQALGFDDEMDFDGNDAPKVYSETFGGRTYQYELVAARYDEADPDADQPEVGNIIMWESGGEHGPSSSAKTCARKLTTHGRGAVLTEDDVHAWLATDVSLRPELEGLRVRFFKVEREGEEYTFYTPVFINLALDEEVTIKNETGTTTAKATEETEPEAEPEVQAAATDGGFPAQIQEFIGFCRDQQIVDPESVLRTLDTMVANPESSVDEAMVEGRQDDIVAAVQA